MLALDGESVAGFLCFYPKAIAYMAEEGPLCPRQEYPSGPSDQLIGALFPSLEEIDDRTFVVHCLMTGFPQRVMSPYQRKGVATRLVRGLED